MSEPTEGTLMHFGSMLFIAGEGGCNVAEMSEPRPLQTTMVTHIELSVGSQHFDEAMANRDKLVVGWNAHDPMVEALELVLAFHSPDTQAFVEKYGTGVGTREMCDRIRAALALAKGPADAFSIG